MSSTADEIVCRFTDNGTGISNEHLARVVELFERLDPGIAGSGVGLPIVKRIVEAHGGTAWIESAGINCGSHVYVSLPRVCENKTQITHRDGQLNALRAFG